MKERIGLSKIIGIRNHRFFGALIFLLGLIFILQGCAMMEASRQKREEKLEKLEKQKKNFLALQKDLENKKVEIGITQEEITERYGMPEDIFGTSSGMSNFALWTYEYPDASKDESRHPVRLYFNDKKLSYWTN